IPSWCWTSRIWSSPIGTSFATFATTKPLIALCFATVRRMSAPGWPQRRIIEPLCEAALSGALPGVRHPSMLMRPLNLIKGAKQMKAVVMHEYGGPDVLKYEDVPDPVPGKGEVLIRIAAASINPVDLWQRAGTTNASLRLEFPAIIGLDLSGTVVGLGPEVREFAVGDHVFAWAFHTYAELCAVKTNILAKIPDGLDLIEAAALPLVTITGSQLISAASGVKAGQTVLVSVAVGGVGRAAVPTAKDRGAIVIAGVRKKQLADPNTIRPDQ